MHHRSTTGRPVVRESHRKAADSFVDSTVGPFRRSDLSKVLYSLTSPRSQTVADQLAESLIRTMAKTGSIQRHGHQHWTKVPHERTLLSGRTVAEFDGITTLPLSTHCPGKWLSLDLETGHVWAGDKSGWRRATPAEREEAKKALT